MAAHPKARRASRQRWLKRRRLGATFGFAIVLVVGAYAAVLNYARPHVGGDRLRFDAFVAAAQSGHLRTIEVLDQDAYIVGDYVRPDGSSGRYSTPLIRDSQGQLIPVLHLHP